MTEKNIRCSTAVIGDSQSLYFNGTCNDSIRISIESGYSFEEISLFICLHNYIYVFFNSSIWRGFLLMLMLFTRYQIPIY